MRILIEILPEFASCSQLTPVTQSIDIIIRTINLFILFEVSYYVLIYESTNLNQLAFWIHGPFTNDVDVIKIIGFHYHYVSIGIDPHAGDLVSNQFLFSRYLLIKYLDLNPM